MTGSNRVLALISGGFARVIPGVSSVIKYYNAYTLWPQGVTIRVHATELITA